MLFEQKNSPIRSGEDRFVIGPSTDYELWRGERIKLNLDRGPCKYLLNGMFVIDLTYNSIGPTATDMLVAFAEAERAWISIYAKPRPMLDSFQTDHSPEEHIEMLDSYIFTIRAGIIGDINNSDWYPALQHPDLTCGNVYIHDGSRPMSISSVLDW